MPPRQLRSAARRGTRAITRAVAVFAVLAQTISCESTGVEIDEPLVITLTPAALDMEVGQTDFVLVRMSRDVVGLLRWSSDNPNVATIDSLGRVRAIAEGSTHVRVTYVPGGETGQASVNVRRITPTIRVDSVRSQGGVRFNSDTISGRVQIHLTAQYLKSNELIDVSVDSAATSACTISGGTGNVFSATCSVDTAAYDSTTGRGFHLNGAHALIFGVRNPTSTTVLLAQQVKQYFIRNFNRMFITRAVPSSDTTWRGRDLSFRVQPKYYEPITAAVAVRLQNTSTGATPMRLAQTYVTGPYPAYVAADNTFASEDEYSLRGDFVSSPTGAPILMNSSWNLRGRYDIIAPRFALSLTPPATVDISGWYLQLSYPHGSYQTGSLIPMNRVRGGVVMGPDACFTFHLHGNNVTILSDDLSSSQGPFVDFVPGACGHGIIVAQTFSDVSFDYSMSITDAAIRELNVSLARATGPCDSGPLNDDVPVTSGTSPGQSQITVVPKSTRDFDVRVSLRVTSSMAGSTYCVRNEARDNTVSSAGQWDPNIGYHISTLRLQNPTFPNISTQHH